MYFHNRMEVKHFQSGLCLEYRIIKIHLYAKFFKNVIVEKDKCCEITTQYIQLIVNE